MILPGRVDCSLFFTTSVGLIDDVSLNKFDIVNKTIGDTVDVSTENLTDANIANNKINKASGDYWTDIDDGLFIRQICQFHSNTHF